MLDHSPCCVVLSQAMLEHAATTYPNGLAGYNLKVIGAIYH